MMDVASGPALSRRHVVRTGVAATAIWVAPSVLTLDRVAAAVPSRPYQAFYTEDFQAGVGGPNAGWSTVQVEAAPADPGRLFLGRFGNQTVRLSLQNLPPHDCLCIEFDFYCIESWDGDHSSYGSDRFGVRLDGTQQMLDSFAYWRFGTRSNGWQFDQTYGPAASNPAGTGTSERDTLGYNRWGNQVFPISLCDLAHTSSVAEIDFFGLGLQGLSDESWGIDNVVISFS